MRTFDASSGRRVNPFMYVYMRACMHVCTCGTAISSFLLASTLFGGFVVNHRGGKQLKRKTRSNDTFDASFGVRAYPCMYGCTHACMQVCTCMYMYVCRHVTMFVCMHGCKYVCVCMHACTYICMHVCLYVCMNICACKYACM